MSAAGDALHMFPTRVARFRIWTEPTNSAASASAGYDVGHRRQRAEREEPVLLANLGVQLGDALDIDDDPGAKRPIAQADDQVCAAGERPGIGAVPVDQGDGVIEPGRTLVGEGSHGSGP